MSQPKQHYVGLPPEGSRASSQPPKVRQTEIVINDATQNDLMQTGITTQDAILDDLMNTGVIVHDVDSQGDGRAERNPQPHQFVILVWFKQLWHWVFQSWFAEPQLQILQKHDRHGNAYWHIYDPSTRHSARFLSETKVRLWIEQFYLRQFR